MSPESPSDPVRIVEVAGSNPVTSTVSELGFGAEGALGNGVVFRLRLDRADIHCLGVSPVIPYSPMSEVSIRDLRNHGGEVIDRVERGERLTVTRDGRQVAELRPVGPLPVKAEVLVERWSRLPRFDPEGLRRDLDAVTDTSL